MNTIIPKAWDIPEVFRNRMGQDVGKQRLMKEAGHHLVVLHELPKKGDRGVRKPALFWVNEVGEWKSMPASGGRSALKQLVQDYHHQVMDLEARLGHMDGDETAENIHEVLDQAAPLYRAVRNLAAVMQELRTALNTDREVLDIRDMALAAELAIDLVLADAKSSLEYLIAKNAMIQAKESAKATKEAQKLNRLAALFFPLVTLASLFGMNPPGETLKHGSVYVVIISGLVMGGLLWLILSKKTH
jgi:Mg2+ and Co2+ transporter CorA